MKYLIIGLGSMGKRRIRNLQALNVKDIIGFDPVEKTRQEVEQKYGIKTFEKLETAIQENPDAYIISTPPDKHMKFCLLAAKNKKHFFVEASVLIEKEFEETMSLAKENDIVAAPSCTFRFHEPIIKIKQIVDSKKFGKALGIHYHMGQYLPDWHPWQDISTFYVGKKETGAAREMVCFELEWINWIFGNIKKISCFKGKYSSLKADIDDTYSLNIEYKKGTIANILIDVVARFAYRQFKILFEDGVLEWDWIKETIRVYDATTKEWTEIKESEGHKEKGYLAKENMYIAEMKNFIEAIEGTTPWQYSLEEDLETLQLLLDFEKSSDKGEHILFD